MPQLTLTFVMAAGLFVALFWSLPERMRPWFMAAGSSAFLWLWDPVSLALLVGLTGAVFLATRLDQGRTRWVWRTGLLLILLVFASVKSWAVLGGEHGIPALVVPIGFGFYLLKLLHYWIELDLRTLPRHRFLLFYNYMLFFPALLVGPIHRFEEFERHERRRRFDTVRMAEGLQHLLYGYAKVIIVANWLVADLLSGFLGNAAAPGSAIEVLGECLVYGLYLYLSFAGFSDVAIGFARLLGQVLAPNFRYPFLQPNLAAFWRSWHMSLSDWCRQYVFVPALARWRRPGLAVVASMLAIGLWHEFTPRYVLWGLYHGLGLAAFRVFERRVVPRLPAVNHALAARTLRGLSTVGTFAFVIIGFAITKNTTLGGMVEDFRTLFTGWGLA